MYGLAGGIVWIIYYIPGVDIVINLLIFVAIQILIFRTVWQSDCTAYILCAMYLARCSKGADRLFIVYALNRFNGADRSNKEKEYITWKVETGAADPIYDGSHAAL